MRVEGAFGETVVPSAPSRVVALDGAEADVALAIRTPSAVSVPWGVERLTPGLAKARAG